MFKSAGKPAFRSSDLDETRQYVANMFKHHHLEIEGVRSKLNALVSRADMGPLTLVHLQHGADVFIDPEMLESFYLLQIPIAGVAQCIVNDETVEMKRGHACLVSPSQRVKMHLKQDCRYFIVKIDRGYVEAQLADELDCSPCRALEFKPDVHLHGVSITGILSLIGHLENRAFEGDPLYARLDIQANAAAMLVRSMLYSFHNNYSDWLRNSSSVAVRPRYIRKAESYINSNVATRLSPGEIAKAASVSVGALHRGFRDYFNMTPMQYVKDRKLLRIRELLGQDSEHSISELAFRFGFDHLGHFAASYKRRFGELPSKTQRGMQ